MTISIVIPVYNASLLIERCLNSVFTQTGDYKIEVICIDDGSTDNSVKIISNYPETIKLLQQTNQGPAAARNKGIQTATGKYLAFLDADDYWEEDFLLETVRFLENNTSAIAVSTGQKHITTGNNSRIVPKILEEKKKLISSPILLKDFFSFWAEHSHICTGSILIKTQIVKKTRGQRTELRITEDLEFWAYLATFGLIGFIPKVLFVSDGIQVTKKLGWIQKNKLRWASAPTVEKWEKRIIGSINDNDFKSYAKARGKIAKNLCYSMIMSNRAKLARMQCIKYGKDFPNDEVARLLVRGAQKQLFWFTVTKIIRYREFARAFFLK